MTERIIGLPPVITEQSKVLILGSMPSVLSLENKEYYGNPRNHFWHILSGVLEQQPVENYEDKIDILKKHNIALWDTIGSCIRDGSLDSSIREEVTNDLPALLSSYPSLQLIACNGTKSYQTLNKYFSSEDLSNLPVIKLPSSSPIPGRYNKTLEEKIEVWKEILTYL
ncbi:DNA-deoxyinosine glycosylase [Ornithinibacillus californiensis]|uniref:DNA-deoxyinosine glycosylase n=1 Tax=Ornithinibacillus californiensis TaxID=161536 RepID=UPI00064DB220|nr:DNA-deoxyinosine glycosylase [Ornithinibacillus californiensis]